MEDPVSIALHKVAETLASFDVSPEVIWSAVVSGVAEYYGWTLDEASENMAALLESLDS